jgi:hypothetical protein
LNLHAWRSRDPLRLNERELKMTRAEVSGWSIPVGVGLTSVAIALLVPIQYISWSGWVYFSMMVLLPLNRWLRKRTIVDS